MSEQDKFCVSSEKETLIIRDQFKKFLINQKSN